MIEDGEMLPEFADMTPAELDRFWAWMRESGEAAALSKSLQEIPVPERNSPCPVCLEQGKQVKWKKCREHNEEAA